MVKNLIFMPIIFLISNILLNSCSSNQLLSNSLPVVTSHASAIKYRDTESLEERADLIVVVKPQASLEDSKLTTTVRDSEMLKKKLILDESVVVKDSEGVMVDRYMATSVKVEKVLKGKVQDNEIKVLQSAAVIREPGQAPYIAKTDGYSPLKKGVKYLLFLKEKDVKYFPNFVGVYSIISVNQGKFNFDATDSEETKEEARDPQYADLKAKVRKKYEAIVNAVP
jgi:hypothetical protein